MLLLASLLIAQAPTLNIKVANDVSKAVACVHDPIRTLLIADMNLASNKKRLYVFNVENPKKPKLILVNYVAHGVGSDPDNTGKATIFSNTDNSRATSLGLYKVAGEYVGKHGVSFHLVGLMAGFNSNAYQRAIDFHPASYVREDGVVGRSFGCPAVNPVVMKSLISNTELKQAYLWIDGYSTKLTSAPLLTCSTAKVISFMNNVNQNIQLLY